MVPDELISLQELGGPSFAMGDHADHVHIGYSPVGGPGAEAQFVQLLKPDQWTRLTDRLSEIDNPDVPTTPSKFSLPAPGKGRGRHGGTAATDPRSSRIGSTDPALRIRAVRVRRHDWPCRTVATWPARRRRGAERARHRDDGRAPAPAPAPAPAARVRADGRSPTAAADARHRGPGARAVRVRRGRGASWLAGCACTDEDSIDARVRRGDRPAQPGAARAGVGESPTRSGAS